MKTCKLISIILFSLLNAGCVATAIKSGAGEASDKKINFPNQGRNMHVVKGGVMFMRADYKSGYRYKLLDDLEMSLQFGNVTVSIPKDVPLIPKTMDGKEYHCMEKASRTFLSSVRNDVCLGVNNGEIFEMRYAPAGYYFTHTFDKKLRASRDEKIVGLSNGNSKIELIFDGANNEAAILTMREYGSDLLIPHQSKSVLLKKGDTRIAEINVNFRITEWDANGLGYIVDTWGD